MADNTMKWIKRLILLVVDLAIAGAIAYSRYVNPPIEGGISLYYALADGFMVVGFLNFGFGALLWISTTGFFDIFGFSFKAILNFFIPRSMMTNKEDFYEYKVKKAEKRKDKPIPFETLFIGIAMILLAIVFNVLVYA